MKLKYSKYFFISRKYKKIYIVKSSAQRTKTPHFSQNPFILAQQRDFGTKKISKSYHSYSLEKKETTINPNKINEESPLLAKLCSDVFTQNILFQNHEDIIKLKKFLKHIDDDLLINYHNISRKTLANLKENPIQYWIYMIVREFEKKVENNKNKDNFFKNIRNIMSIYK